MAENLFGSMEISASGMSAQRARMEAIAKNVANAETTRTEEGGPYRRRYVSLANENNGGSHLSERPTHRVALACTSPNHIARARSQPEGSADSSGLTVEAHELTDDDAGFILVHDPSHPDADDDGLVRLPDINTITEMVDLMAATRAYEANLAAMKAYQSIVAKSLEI